MDNDGAPSRSGRDQGRRLLPLPSFRCASARARPMMLRARAAVPYVCMFSVRIDKVLRYLPFLPRIQRLFMTEESAQQMRRAVDGKRYRPKKMVHPSDGDAWKHFIGKHPRAGYNRSVAVALSTDGFNPYGMSACTYSCWPMFVIPLNLPPGVCMRLITEFWDYFQLVEGKDESATKVLINMAKKLIPNQLYEARVECVVHFYAEQMMRKISKEMARPIHMSRPQYMKVVPQWLAAQKPCYKKIVDKWVSDRYLAQNKEQSARRKMIGEYGNHCQGPLTLDGVIAHKEKKEGRKLTKMQAFIETRRPKEPEAGKPLEDQWITATAKNQKENYCSKFKECNGDTSDPVSSPFDPMIAMYAGQGRLNGRPYIGGGFFDSSALPSLAEIRAMRTSSAPEIERRPRLGLGALAAMEAEVEKARKIAAEATARAQQTEEKVVQMQGHLTSQQTLLQAIMARMPADSSLPPLPPLPPLAPLLLVSCLETSMAIPSSAGSHTLVDVEDGGNGGDGAAIPSSAPSPSNMPK